MFSYYEDNNLMIGFSKNPHIDFRYPCPGDTCSQKRDKLEKPFINLEPVDVQIRWVDNKTKIPFEYFFTIPQDYTWDGASIPRVFWRIIGAKTDPKFMIASMIHDYLCENKKVVNNDRYLSTIVLEKLCQVGGTNAFQRWLIKHSVDNYQKLVGDWHNG